MYDICFVCIVQNMEGLDHNDMLLPPPLLKRKKKNKTRKKKEREKENKEKEREKL